MTFWHDWEHSCSLSSCALRATSTGWHRILAKGKLQADEFKGFQ